LREREREREKVRVSERERDRKREREREREREKKKQNSQQNGRRAHVGLDRRTVGGARSMISFDASRYAITKIVRDEDIKLASLSLSLSLSLSCARLTSISNWRTAGASRRLNDLHTTELNIQQQLSTTITTHLKSNR
jgi:hypothetical protein